MAVLCRPRADSSMSLSIVEAPRPRNRMASLVKLARLARECPGGRRASDMRFAIVGAADERPDQSPPIDVQKARDAAAFIGTALAKRGHGLVVYDAKYIEADVVTA